MAAAVSGSRDPARARTANLAALLRALRAGPLSRTQLAARCRLTKATVSGLLTELSERGLVRAAGVLNSGSGRPSQLVELDGDSAYGLALSVEADGFAAVATNLAGEVIAARHESVDVASLGLARSMDELALLAGQVRRGDQPIGVAVSVPGLVDPANAVLRFAPTLRWRDAEIADLLAARLGLDVGTVSIDNEANLAAIGEAVAGTGATPGSPTRATAHPETRTRTYPGTHPGTHALTHPPAPTRTHTAARAGMRELFYLSGGMGVGGGLVVGGTVLRGARGFAGEVGHIAVDPSGELCPCGRTGCLETKAGINAVVRAAAPPGDPLHDPALGVDGRVTVLRQRMRVGDQRTHAAVAELGIALGIAVSTVVDVLDPDVVVLGGSFAGLGAWLVEPIRRELAARTLGQESICRVEVSTLGTKAPLRGAAHLAVERLFADPTIVSLAHEEEPA